MSSTSCKPIQVIYFVQLSQGNWLKLYKKKILKNQENFSTKSTIYPQSNNKMAQGSDKQIDIR
jgi:hypothetical protein